MVTSLERLETGVLMMLMKLKMAIRKERPHAPQATVKIPERLSSLPSSPSMMKPSRGGSSTHKLRLAIHLASQYVHVVNIDIAARAEDSDDKCQSNHHLSSSHREDKENKRLSIR